MAIRLASSASHLPSLLGSPRVGVHSPSLVSSSAICCSTGKPQQLVSTQLRDYATQPQCSRALSGFGSTRGSTVSASAAAQPSVSAELSREGADSQLVDELLTKVKGTDSGAADTAEGKARVIEIVERLEQAGLKEPLRSPLIFGEWDVVYTSNPTAAGGYYRTLLGRVLLKTTEMVQSIQEPDGVNNLVGFRALNILPGKVTLEGKFNALDSKWVEVTFAPPTFTVGNVKFAYGGESKVKLSTTYLDERVRIGRGSRGSIFVFQRRA